MNKLKVAIVHEWLTIYGGSEKVTETIHELFPDAPIYCLVYDEITMPAKYREMDIRPTFVQKMPFSKKHYKAYLPMMPRAYEELDLSGYDLVISSSTACAKGVITSSDSVHICYCHTPVRYFWEFYHDYTSDKNPFVRYIMSKIIHKLRMWDYLAAQRPDYFIANSSYVQRRIEKYYRRKSQVIFPPVNCEDFYISDSKKDYYLVVSRLVGYKRVDIAVDAFSQMPDKKLYIIGDGPQKDKLKKNSTSNIVFMGKLSDKEVRKYYSEARAFIFPGIEDFGITPVESMASGTPVICYAKGGILDTVVDGVTGVYFYEQSAKCLIDAVDDFEKNIDIFNLETIRQRAIKFDKNNFKEKMKKHIENVI